MTNTCLDATVRPAPEHTGRDRRKQAMIVAEAACAPDDTMCNMPFEVTPEMVANAILGADALGHYYLMDE